MATATINGDVAIAGLSLPILISRTDEGSIAQEVTLPKGWAGNLSTRTDADTGVFTTTEAHDITTDDFVWFFWTLAGVPKVAYYCDVTGIGANEVTIDLCVGSDGDSGDELPLATQTGIIAAGVEINVDFDGDDVSLISAYLPSLGHMRFNAVTPAELHEQDLVANRSWFWADDMSWTNPLTGLPVDAIWAAQGDITEDKVLKLGVLYDSTP